MTEREHDKVAFAHPKLAKLLGEFTVTEYGTVPVVASPNVPNDGYFFIADLAELDHMFEEMMSNLKIEFKTEREPLAWWERWCSRNMA